LGAGPGVDDRYRVRAIRGVPAETAVAVWERGSPPESQCGGWSFSPNQDTSREEARRVARLVTSRSEDSVP